MATLTRPSSNGKASRLSKPRPKPPRQIGWTMAPKPGHPYGVLHIIEGGKRDDYFIRAIEADFGLGVEVTKLTGEPDNPQYNVNLDDQREHHSCECPGFLRWGHCKHIEGLVALARAGKLF
jgi:hypothetical protein